MALNVVAASAALAIGAWYLRRVVPVEVVSTTFDSSNARLWGRSARVFALLGVVQLGIQSTDILVLGLFEPAESVGIYKIAVQMSVLTIFGYSAINMVVPPLFAVVGVDDDRAAAKRLLRLSAYLSVVAAVPFVFLYAAFGTDLLILLFGRDYVSAYPAMVILSVAQLINAATGSVGTFLNMTGNERHTVRGVAVAAATNVALAFVLVPQFGGIGAAMSTAAAIVTWNAYLSFCTWKLLAAPKDRKPD
jgi:O-antigen/teichoic acid export membrane protein